MMSLAGKKLFSALAAVSLRINAGTGAPFT